MRKILAAISALLLVAVPRIALADIPTLTNTQTLTASGDVKLQLAGQGTCSVVVGNTWTGTVSFKVSGDGTTLAPVSATPPGSTTAVTSSTANGTWVFSSAGMSLVDINFNFTSGSVTITLTCGAGGGASGSIAAATIPTGTAGAPNSSVVTVQGISGGTSQPVTGAGTAGSADAGVVTVQGIAGGTNINVAPFGPGKNVSGTGQFPVACSQHAFINPAASGDTQIVAASGTTVIYVCAIFIMSNGNSSFKLDSADTGGTCANPSAKSGTWGTAQNVGFAWGNGFGALWALPSGKAACINVSTATSGTTGGSVDIVYDQF